MLKIIKEHLERFLEETSHIKMTMFIILSALYLGLMVTFVKGFVDIIFITTLYYMISTLILSKEPIKKILPMICIILNIGLASVLAVSLETISKQDLLINRTFALYLFVFFGTLSIGYNNNEKASGTWIISTLSAIIFGLMLSFLIRYEMNGALLYILSVIAGFIFYVVFKKGADYVLSLRNKK